MAGGGEGSDCSAQYLLYPVQCPCMVESVDRGRQASVETEDLERGQGQEQEQGAIGGWTKERGEGDYISEMLQASIAEMTTSTRIHAHTRSHASQTTPNSSCVHNHLPYSMHAMMSHTCHLFPRSSCALRPRKHAENYFTKVFYKNHRAVSYMSTVGHSSCDRRYPPPGDV